MGVANTRALESADINRDTPEPKFGVIDRDPEGEITGLVRGNAVHLVTDVIKWGLEEKLVAIKQACRDFHAVGFTSVIEPGLMGDEIEAFRESHLRGELTHRVQIMVGMLHSLEETQWAVDNYPVGGDDKLRIAGLKIMLDGGVGPRTALFYENYLDKPGVYGDQLIPREELNKMIELGHSNGFQLAVHGIGDKAIDIILDALEHAQKTNPRPNPRHQIVHCYFPSETAIKKMVNLGVNMNTQTAFMYFLGESFIQNIGLERCKSCMPAKTLTRLGIPVGNSHDATVTQPLPNIELYSAVTRKTIKGNTLGTEEAVDPFTALSFYAISAAKHSFMEDKIGSIEVGKYADLAIWNFNPLEVEAEKLKDWKCEMTYVEGKRVYPE